MTTIIMICLSLIALSWLVTRILMRYAVKKNMVDIPNERSSHITATPRGGGVAILIAFIIGLLIYASVVPGTWQLSAAFLIASLLVGIVGFVDDHGHVSAAWRLSIHFSAAVVLLVVFGGPPPLVLFDVIYVTGVAGWLVFALCMVWLLNLYNFMDGIDGIAGIEAVTVCLSAAAIGSALDASPVTVALPLLLASAVMGFLFWNFPSARIFMGDSGSGFLGLVLSGLVLQSAWEIPQMIWVWSILLGVFVVDATVTLIRRIIHRENLLQGHCSHAYQYAARGLKSHAKVTVIVGIINVVWLLPVATLVAVEYMQGAIGLIVAYSPLIVLALRLKAGVREVDAI